jgi:Hemingway/CFA97
MKQSVRNKKTIQLDEERNTEIERENRILLEKITRILKSKQHGPKDAAINFETARSKSQMYCDKQQVYKSMKRIKENQRISDENQVILYKFVIL